MPIANIPLAVSRLKKIGDKYGVAIPVLGHAGDGNLHAVPLKPADDTAEHWEEILPALLKEIYVTTSDLTKEVLNKKTPDGMIFQQRITAPGVCVISISVRNRVQKYAD